MKDDKIKPIKRCKTIWGVFQYDNSSHEIYRQYNLYEVRDQFNEQLFEVRENRGNNIDFSKSFSNITQ